MRTKICRAVAILSLFAVAILPLPAFATTATQLEAQLAAQIEINKLLKARIHELEAEVSALRAGSLNGTTSHLFYEAPPEDLADLDESDGALEEALVQRGSAVLPPWQKQITPSLSWSHSGSGGSASDSITASLSGRIGLPGDMMVGVSVPYVAYAHNSMGDNNGFGSVSATLWKQIVAPGEHYPSVVGSLTYSAPTGENVFETPVATGSAFHAVTAGLSATKKIDPVAFYGDVFYTYAFEKNVGGMDRQPGDVFGFSAGVSLAATPGISLQAGVGLAFAGKDKKGMAVSSSDRTIGTVNLGAGFVLAKNKYLSIGGSFGVTDDAPDFTLGASMPMRF